MAWAGVEARLWRWGAGIWAPRNSERGMLPRGTGRVGAVGVMALPPPGQGKIRMLDPVVLPPVNLRQPSLLRWEAMQGRPGLRYLKTKWLDNCVRRSVRDYGAGGAVDFLRRKVRRMGKAAKATQSQPKRSP